MLSDYEGCCAQASVSVLSLCVRLCVTAEKARRGWVRRLVANLERSSRLAAAADGGRECVRGDGVGRVSKIVYACACSIFLHHRSLRRLPVEIQICKKSVGVHPVASSLAINEATHIEWLHKKGVVDGCRCRRPIAKALNRSHADFVQNRLSLNLRLFRLTSCGEAQLSRRRVSISQLCYSQHGTGPARH